MDMYKYMHINCLNFPQNFDQIVYGAVNNGTFSAVCVAQI